MRRAASMLLTGGLTAATLLSTSTAAFASTPAVHTHRAAWTVHAGNTLSQIGVRVHRSYEQLAAFNHIADPNLIFVGEVVRIPPSGYEASVPAPVQQPVVETVQAPTHSAAYVPVSTGYGSAPASFQGCVIYAESRGDATAQNPTSTASGLYGFLDSTWQTVTGLPGSASEYSAAQQTAAFERLYAEVGTSAWAPFDGC